MAIRKKTVTENEARLKMADLCARSEQCEFDINQKLFRLGLYTDQRERIISFLKEERFIDHQRFARSFARDKCRFSAWGPFKIRQGLSLKRIPSSLISEALDEIEEEEWNEALNKAARSKEKGLDLIGERAKENRIKLYKFLLSRGFENDSVKEKVKQMVIKQKRENEGMDS